MSDAERKLRASTAAHESWARTEDPTARTQRARSTFRQSFEDQVDPERKLDPADRARRGDHAYRAHMKRLALKSAKARRLRAGGGDDDLKQAS